ncbi:MAG: FlgO family outer membrane protein [Thermodesulfovibrionales bacterium]|nr:FlgO family outer membrane protein [Thermodesulfovibrionales bacterium]
MRKLVFVIFVSLTFLLSYPAVSTAYENEIRSLSNAMADNIAKAGKKRIAVVDFTDLQGNITELGRFIAEEMSVTIAGADKGIEVVDRTHLKTIFKEHKLAMSGVIDPTTAKKLGQIAGVDALVTGTITPFGDSVRISVKILDTATAKVIGASSGDIPKTKTIEELLGRGIGTETTGQIIPTTPSATKPKTLTRIEANDFIFEAKACKREGQHKVLCYIAITNNLQKTRSLTILIGGNWAGLPPQSIIVDDFGSQYNSVELQFGGKNVRGDYSITYDIPPNLPMNLVIAYDEVLPEAKYVSVIVNCRTDKWPGDPYFKAVLRNIPLSR